MLSPPVLSPTRVYRTDCSASCRRQLEAYSAACFMSSNSCLQSVFFFLYYCCIGCCQRQRHQLTAKRIHQNQPSVHSRQLALLHTTYCHFYTHICIKCVPLCVCACVHGRLYRMEAITIAISDSRCHLPF